MDHICRVICLHFTALSTTPGRFSVVPCQSQTGREDACSTDSFTVLAGQGANGADTRCGRGGRVTWSGPGRVQGAEGEERPKEWTNGLVQFILFQEKESNM